MISAADCNYAVLSKHQSPLCTTMPS